MLCSIVASKWPHFSVLYHDINVLKKRRRGKFGLIVMATTDWSGEPVTRGCRPARPGIIRDFSSLGIVAALIAPTPFRATGAFATFT